MAILFILLPKVVYSTHNTMEFFDFTSDLKLNEYDQLKPSARGLVIQIRHGASTRRRGRFPEHIFTRVT